MLLQEPHQKLGGEYGEAPPKASNPENEQLQATTDKQTSWVAIFPWSNQYEWRTKNEIQDSPLCLVITVWWIG